MPNIFLTQDKISQLTHQELVEYVLKLKNVATHQETDYVKDVISRQAVQINPPHINPSQMNQSTTAVAGQHS